MKEEKKIARDIVKAKDASEKQRISAYQAKVRESMKDEIKVRFQNIESPGFNLEFTYEGIKQYNLLDGYEYNLPKVVVNHLNSLTQPVYEWQEDKDTKLQKCNIVGRKNRFSCIPVSV